MIEQIKGGKVDIFRRDFDTLSFDEVSQIYDGVTPHFGAQRHFTYGQFKYAANAVGLSGVVVELGDHDGELARLALQDFPAITEWVGFDVCPAEERLEHQKYRHVELTDWFEDSGWLDGVDAFVSTHTLEHMSKKAAFKVLNFVSKSPVKKMVIEMPFHNRGNWNGSTSLHVFKGHPADVSNFLNHAGWEIVHHGKKGINHMWGAVR